jgi:hypothetical protein
MKLVERHVAKRQTEFGNHPFFADSRFGFQPPDSLSFAPDITFWVMTFQDILRLNAALTQDPQIRRIVRHHRAEDAGHQLWFLEDLAAMKLGEPDVRSLFGKRQTPTRDAAYALMSEVFRADDDRLRLVLVKTLESAGHIFFGRVSAIVERAGWTKTLKYFSFSHLEVEKNHQVFEEEISRIVSAIRLPADVRAEAKQVVDRCYAAFSAMFDAFCTSEARPANSVAPEVAGRPPIAVRRSTRPPQISVGAVPTRGTTRQIRVRG